MKLPSLVDEVVEAYLNAIDAKAPGLLTGLYLVGSVALGDFHPQTSDIDLVAVTDRPLAGGDLAALESVHMQLRRRWPRPFFDGTYVTWDMLARDPALAGPGPYSHEGLFYPRTQGSCGNPIIWHTIAGHGIACRGPEPFRVNIWADRDVLVAWTLGNIGTYWRRLVHRASRPTNLWSLAACSPYGAVWIALGITRLHYTVATGEVISKDRAGVYALGVFPQQWRRIVTECLRIRRADSARPDMASALRDLRSFLPFQRDGRSLYRSPFARRRDVIRYAEMVIADTHRISVRQ